jgi:hypothetical protein
MSGFTDWFSVNIVGIVTYVMSWYDNLARTKDNGNSGFDSEEEWGQFIIIDEENI